MLSSSRTSEMKSKQKIFNNQERFFLRINVARKWTICFINVKLTIGNQYRETKQNNREQKNHEGYKMKSLVNVSHYTQKGKEKKMYYYVLKSSYVLFAKYMKQATKAKAKLQKSNLLLFSKSIYYYCLQITQKKSHEVRQKRIYKNQSKLLLFPKWSYHY